jgi:hypothetical protein
MISNHQIIIGSQQIIYYFPSNIISSQQIIHQFPTNSYKFPTNHSSVSNKSFISFQQIVTSSKQIIYYFPTSHNYFPTNIKTSQQFLNQFPTNNKSPDKSFISSQQTL